MKAEIIAVGTEILLGNTINTDAADVSALLNEYGINVYWHTVVGDNPERVEQAVRAARARADLIITTGGLGPTCDDLTKAALAKAFGLSLRLDKNEEIWLRDLFAGRGREMTPNNLQQVYLPEGSTALRNDWGTAPGCTFTLDGVTVIMLPGPPREIRSMLEYRVRPLLEKMSEGMLITHKVKFYGIGEGEMEYKLRDYMNSLSNPTLAPYAKEYECYVRVAAKAETKEKAEEMMLPVIQHVKDVMGDLVYGIDCTLPERAMELLKEHNVTLSAAESCTGGELAKLLTDIPGASRYFMGGVTVYTNEAKHKLLGLPVSFIDKYGAVSGEVAHELAAAVREKLGTDLAVSVTGLAGPDGDGVHDVGTVFVSLATPENIWTNEMHVYNRPRRVVRARACQTAFDMIRRYLTGIPVGEVGEIL